MFRILRQYQLELFFVVALAISAIVMWVSVVNQVDGISILVPLSPSIIAIILSIVLEGKKGFSTLVTEQLKFRFDIRWYLVAIGLLPIIGLCALGIHQIFGGNEIALRTTRLLPDVIVIILIALGEEFGWRGFALPRLQKRFNALTASLILGVIWGLWHLPGYLAGTGVPLDMPFYVFMLWVIPATIIMTWAYNNTSSIIMPILIHMIANATFNYLPILPEWAGQITTFWIFLGLLWATTSGVILHFGHEKLSRQLRSSSRF